MHQRVRKLIFFLMAMTAVNLMAGQKIDWSTKNFNAGRVSLETGFFTVKHNLGIANFSPEFRMPVEAVYNSGSTKYGHLSRAWSLAQLESKLITKVNGATWITPWGQELVFHAKSQHPSKQKVKLECFCIEADYAATETGSGWQITGTRKNRGWQFNYQDGKLLKITAPSGRKLVFSYDSSRRLTAVSENGTAFIRLTYSTGRPIASSVNINGVKHSLSYKPVKTVTLMKNFYGNARIATDQMLVALRSNGIAAFRFAYDKAGYLTSVTNGKNIRQFVVDTESIGARRSYLGKLSQIKKGNLKPSALKRDHIAGRLLRDENFTYAYPGPGVIRLTNHINQTAEYRFDRDMGILQVKNIAGQERTYYYYRRFNVAYSGKLRKVTDGRGRTLALYKYFPKSGQLKSVKLFNGNTMSYEYDRNDQLIKVLRSVKGAKPVALAAYTCDDRGNRLTAGRLAADGSVYSAASFVYDQLNQPEKITSNFDRRFAGLSYNAFGYISKVGDAFGETTYQYDNYNRLTTMLNPDGIKTAYTYNPAGALREVKVTHNSRLLTRQIYQYDRYGLVQSVKDSKGLKTSVRRDQKHRVTATTLPNGSVIKYGYDKLGRLSWVKDRNQHKIKFAFNAFGKLAKRLTPSGQLSSWDYNKFGQLVSLRDSRNRKTDRGATYSYNQLDQLEKVVFADGSSKAYTHDDLGRITGITAVNAAGQKSVTTLKYDFFNRVIAKTETVGDRKVSFTYNYNKADQRTAMRVRYDNGLSTAESRTYTELGQLAEIQNDSSQQLRYEYDTRGRISRQIANGAEIRFQYNKLGRLQSKIMGPEKFPIASVKYFYAPDGQITARSVNSVKQVYAYDEIGQLLSVSANGKVLEKYQYDPAGNILSQMIDGKTTTFKYDASNQLVSSTINGKTTSYEYDAAGRLTREGATSYSYNFWNKVAKAGSESYSYFASGQIAQAAGDGKKENFTWDGLALIRRDKTNYMNEPYITGGNPVLAGSSVLFNDLLGSSLGIKSNGKFNPISRTAFGSVRQAADNENAKTDFFTGKPHIKGLGYAFLFRNYRPKLGKWQTTDPIGYPDGWNNLAYGNNHGNRL